MIKELEKEINDYTEREFDTNFKWDGENLIPLAYTTDPDDDFIEMEVVLDLENLTINTFRGGKEVESIEYSSQEEIADDLKYCSFDDLIRAAY